MPEPQRKLAGMLPLSGLPPEWTLGKPGDHHLETFNADNLYEKIDGRAESFIQYGVKGMAYTFYHPTGDPSNELQLYVFEMADSLKALGKYGSEKPEEFQTVAVGDAGYTSAGSLLFYCGAVLHPDRLHQGRPQVRGVCSRLSPSEWPAFKRAALLHQAATAAGAAPAATAANVAAPAEHKLGSRPAPSEAKAEPKEISPATYFGSVARRGTGRRSQVCRPGRFRL